MMDWGDDKRRFFAHHPQTEKRLGPLSTTPSTKTYRWGPRYTQNDSCNYVMNIRDRTLAWTQQGENL